MPAALLVIGDAFSPVMDAVRRCVEALVAEGCDLRLCPALPARGETSDDGSWFPDVVIICQYWPDEFTPRDVKSLFERFPLAAVSCCYGPWCGSDARTREIWPLSVRVPVRDAAARIRRQLAAIAGVGRALPLTASREEIFLFDAQEQPAALARLAAARVAV